MFVKLSTLLVTLVWLLNNQKVTAEERLCHSARTCDACVTQLGCAWCSSFDFSGGPRCQSEEDLVNANCPKSEIENPKSSLDVVDEEIPVSLRPLRPRKVTLKLRPNETAHFQISFAQPTEFPVDLYYLMDLTYSMKAHQEKLVELADKLSASMSNITSNFRLGFGSFIDKVVMPFANTVPAKLLNPCPGDFACSAPYGFRNHLSLTGDVTAFMEQVNSTVPSANLDNAEGGFDALMQVIVCRKEIDWHSMSRKIVIFATDGIFHYAGDGKLGGVVKRNDAACHLDKNGYYTASSLQDYPALSQINNAINEHKINIIYAVPQKELGTYQRLSTIIDGSVAALLSEDSSNIVEVIQENYERIVAKIELRHNASSNVKIKYFSSCLNSDGPKQETRTCDGIRFGDKVTFEVEVKATNCIGNGQETFRIYPIGIDQDIVVDVTVACGCDCKNTHSNATECSFSGNMTCGLCTCEPNMYGKTCDCQGGQVARDVHRAQCLSHPNASDTCSDRGDCVCGECQCNKPPNSGDQIYGQFCECDTFSCERASNGQVCGGPTRGRCCDFNCECSLGWTGPACDCTTDTKTCYNPATDSICSGNGKCVCGSCECNKEEGGGQYAGKYCEQCVACTGMCVELEQCVRCFHFKEGIYNSSDCGKYCSEHDVDIVDAADAAPLWSSRDCIVPDGDDCQIAFSYGYDVILKKIRVKVKQQRDCRQDYSLWIIIASIAGLIVLIGIIFLFVCRFLVYLKDKREFLQHAKNEEKDRMAMQTKETNPLYKEPKTRYANPTYKQAAR